MIKQGIFGKQQFSVHLHNMEMEEHPPERNRKESDAFNLLLGGLNFHNDGELQQIIISIIYFDRN